MKKIERCIGRFIGRFCLIWIFPDVERYKWQSPFGDLNARHIGPALMSGRINDMEAHPTNSRIIYAGTAGGGVWNPMMGEPLLTPFLMSIANP